MKKNTLRALAFSLIFCMCLGGLFVSPLKALADVKTKTIVINGSDVSYAAYCRTGTYTATLLNKNTNGVYGAASSYTTFRFWIYFGEDLPKNSTVDVYANFAHASGTIKSLECWFGYQAGQNFACDSLDSNIVLRQDSNITSLVNTNNSFFLGTFNVTNGNAPFCVEIVYSSRTANDMYFGVNSLVMYADYEEQDINEGIADLNTTSGNIWDTLKSVLTGLTNLPANIKTQLTSLFNSVTTAIGNVVSGISNLPSLIGSSLSSFFTDLSNNIKALPSNLSSFFTTLGTNFGTFINNLGDRIGGFFSPLTDKITSIFNSLFVMDDLDPELQGTINDIQSSSDSFNDLANDLQIDKPDLEEFMPAAPSNTYVAKDNLASLLVSIPFGSEISVEFVTMAFSFALMGLILYGKR